MSDPARPPRVRVTAPRSSGPRRRTPRTATVEIDAQTEVGEIFLRSLLRAQLRLSATVLVLLVVLVGGLPLVFRAFPALTEARLFGMPIAWGVLAFGIYPLLLALGAFYVRRAERVERAFTDVVEGS